MRKGNSMTTSDILTALGLADEETAKRLAIYHDTILDLNRHINLTGIKDPDESLSKNVYDSLSAYEKEYFPEGGRFLDLGTGAGFPGALLAILRPDMQAVLMDAVQKKLTCVEKALDAAGAKNAKCIHMRAEDGGRRRKLRESFDIVIARAVKSLPVICEWALPFVSVGGTFIAMKGPGAEDELASAQKILALMETSLTKTKTVTLPTGETRVILYLTKQAPTPKTFPRKVGIAEKSPIV